MHTTTRRAAPQPAYLLGHAADEQQRLMSQANYIGELTAQLFRSAGLSRGMRVLDIGCGVGDVSLLAADMVGAQGEVIGVDNSAAAIATARQRASQAGVTNVRFVCADLDAFEPDAPFDAIVGRLVLLYFPDPAALLRRLLRHLVPGGLVACHEIDIESVRSEPHCELLAQTVERIVEAFRRSRLDVRTGLKLSPIFEQAGLPAPRMIAAARVERGAGAALHEYAAATTRTLLPVIEQTGIASGAEVGIDTLAARLCAEALQLDATLISPAYIGAWSRLPTLQ